MYVPRGDWSAPEPGDPGPCLRQGDLVRVTWANVKLDPPNSRVQGFHVEMRTEVVSVLSADCDLVDRMPPKRKGVLVSPLRDVPKNIARDPELLAGLKAPVVQVAGEAKIPVNLAYFEKIETDDGSRVDEGVVHLEMMTMLTFASLKAATKVAELTEEKRQDLRERLKFHFGREPTR